MISKSLFIAAGCCLMAAIIYVPIGYGGTLSRASTTLNVIAITGFMCWALALLCARRLPRIPLSVVAPVFALLAWGWLSTWNARSIHDASFWQYLPLEQRFMWLPSSVDAHGSCLIMTRLTAFFGAFLVACDLCRDRRWARAIIITMACVGTATAAFGIWQKTSSQPFLIWPVPVVPPTAFATFWYHGNAASYLNLAWPLLLALTLHAFSREGHHASRAFWLASLVISFAALALNVSKAGHAIAILLTAATLAVFASRLRHLRQHHGTRPLFAYGLLVLAALVIGALLLDWGPSWKRWHEYFSRTTGESRLVVAGICLDLVRAGGVYGYGPGTFDAVFQHHVSQGLVEFSARWKHAHNDYLQALVEWGWPGVALWAWLLFTPLNISLGVMRSVIFPRHEAGASRTLGLRFGASLALLGLLAHACYDFPLQIAGIQLHTLILSGILVAQYTTTRLPSPSDHAVRPPVI